MPTTSAPRPSRRLAIAAIALLLAVLAAGVAGAAGSEGTPALKRVEARKVCMINNQLFDKDQIPVAVEGRTYYGCCEMCKEKLTKDPASRQAVDPVTGNKVDKATAVIGAKADGGVLYFESEETLKKYQAPAGS